MKLDNMSENPDTPRSFLTSVSVAIVSWTASLLKFPAALFPSVEGLINLPLRLIERVGSPRRRFGRAERAEALREIGEIIEADPTMSRMPHVLLATAEVSVKIPLPQIIMTRYDLISGDIVTKEQAKQLIRDTISWGAGQNNNPKAEKLTILVLGG